MTKCYAMVRGSTLRATALLPSGLVPHPAQKAVFDSVVRVEVNELTDTPSDEVVSTEQGRQLVKIVRDDDAIGFSVNAEFLRVDASLISLMTGVPVVFNSDDDVVGFDMDTRLPVTSFALEVWTKLDIKGQWGHTLFPFLAGGYLSRFSFEGTTSVTFTLTGASTQMGSQWAVGPHDLEGLHERLLEHVSRNGAWTSTVLTTPPPVPTAGTTEFDDTIYGGTAAYTSSDILAGGSAATTTPWIINGGRA